jgi:serine/threonine protein kinase
MASQEPDPSEEYDIEKEYRVTEGDALEFDLPSVEALNAELSGYEVQEIIGIGGMGAVYRGYQPQLDRPIAVKVFRPGGDIAPEFTEHFRSEARAMARMNQTNIIAVHDFGETQSGLLYIVMEFVEGELLFDLIERGGVTIDMAVEIMRQTCDALQYAHYQGVVHRDIKPSNIIISTTGDIKIADFGLSKLNLSEGASSGLGDAAYGTAEYVAPEVMDDESEVDYRADIYSLGVLFYEMIVGQPPRGSYSWPSELVNTDPRFDHLIATAMNPDREGRYQQALDFKTTLETIVSTPNPANQPIKLAAARAAVRPMAHAGPSRMIVPVQTTSSLGVWLLVLIAIGGCVGGYYFVKAQEEKKKKGPIKVIVDRDANGIIKDLVPNGATLDPDPDPTATVNAPGNPSDAPLEPSELGDTEESPDK